MRYLVFIVLFLAGFLGATRAYAFAHFFGRMAWAERRFGVGGTYVAWRLGGLAAIGLGFAILRFPGYFGL